MSNETGSVIRELKPRTADRELTDDEAGIEERGGVIFTRSHVSIQPVVENVVDGELEGERLVGFWLVALEADQENQEVPGGREARIPIDAAAMKLLCSSVLDYLDRLEQTEAAEGPNTTELIVAPASALGELGRAERRRAERATRKGR